MPKNCSSEYNEVAKRDTLKNRSARMRCWVSRRKRGTKNRAKPYIKKLKKLSADAPSPQKLICGDADRNVETPATTKNAARANQNLVLGNENLPAFRVFARKAESATNTNAPARIALFSATGDAVNGKKNTGTSPKRRYMQILPTISQSSCFGIFVIYS